MHQMWIKKTNVQNRAQVMLLRDKSGRCLIIGQTESGVEEA